MRTLVVTIPSWGKNQSEGRCFVDEGAGIFGVFGAVDARECAALIVAEVGDHHRVDG